MLCFQFLHIFTNSCWVFKKFYLFIYLFLLFKATPMAYGGSQARGQIGAVAASLHHSHSYARSKPCLQPTPSSWQCQIFNLLSGARDRTCILMDSFPLHDGNSLNLFKREKSGVLWWVAQWVRIQHCHLGYYSSTGSIPGLRISACHRYSQNQ